MHVLTRYNIECQVDACLVLLQGVLVQLHLLRDY